jgi:hypothetical protein
LLYRTTVISSLISWLFALLLVDMNFSALGIGEKAVDQIKLVPSLGQRPLIRWVSSNGKTLVESDIAGPDRVFTRLAATGPHPQRFVPEI